jgi:hypothetical protein
MVARQTRDGGAEVPLRYGGVDAQRLRRIETRRQGGTVHAVVAPIVLRLQVDGRPFRAAVDHEAGAGLGDTGQVEELAVLPKRHLSRRPGRPEYERGAVPDLGHQLRPPGGVLVGREDLVTAKHRLRGRRRHQPGCHERCRDEPSRQTSAHLQGPHHGVQRIGAPPVAGAAFTFLAAAS